MTPGQPMTAHTIGALLGVLVVAALACGPREEGGPAPEAPRLPAAEVPSAASAPAAATAASQEEDAVAPLPELDDLLHLPASLGKVDPVADRLESGGDLPAEGASDPKQPRARIELERGVEAVGPTAKKQRTEVGAAVDVGSKATVRSGVRARQESGAAREDPIPTVGVEVRF